MTLTAGCGSNHGTAGFSTKKPIDRTISIWKDGDGLYTCPPAGPIEASEPPGCGAKKDDRVRVIGKVVAPFEDRPVDSQNRWVADVAIRATASDGGFTLHVTSAKEQERRRYVPPAPKPH